MQSRKFALVAVLCALASLNVRAQPVAVGPESARIVHLLNRAGYGPRAGDVERVRQRGFAEYVEDQLRQDRSAEPEVETRLASFETLVMDPATLRARYQRDPRPVLEQLQGQKIVRALYSPRQLQEVMVDFWSNHFNVDWSKAGVEFAVTGYERDAIRPYALGKFADLLRATARHPAMLVYLDNAASTSGGINENYARELLELHTLGVDGGYSQKDVESVAQCFTGWTLDAAQNQFEFKEALHANGDRVVLGQTIPSGGRSEGEEVLTLLARHPRTARFISTKLVQRFVSDDPPALLVDRVAEVFVSTGGDIPALLRTIFNSKEFVEPANIRSKVKSPFETVVSAIRAIDGDLAITLDSQTIQGNLRNLPSGDVVLQKSGGARIRISPAVVLTRTIQEMGQFPYQKPEPTGYPERSDYWLSGWTVLHRMNFAVSLVNNQVLGTTVNPARFAATFAVAAKSEAPWTALLQAIQSPPERARAELSDERSPALLDALALALGSPEFQRK